MGATQGGQRDRWESMRARRDQLGRDIDAIAEVLVAAYGAAHPEPDPISAFAAAVGGIGRPKRRGVDAGRMVAEGRAELAKIQAGRDARAQRNAAVARQAWKVYQNKRAQLLDELDQAADDHEPSRMIAASMHQTPPRIQLF